MGEEGRYNLKVGETPIKTMKTKITVTVDSEIIDWVNKKAETREFRSRSHVVEVYLARCMKEEEKKAE